MFEKYAGHCPAPWVSDNGVDFFGDNDNPVHEGDSPYLGELFQVDDGTLNLILDSPLLLDRLIRAEELIRKIRPTLETNHPISAEIDEFLKRPL